MSRPRTAFISALVSYVLLAQAAQAGINFIGTETANVAPKPEFMAVGDLNNDGRGDVVVVSPSSREIDTFVAADTPSHFAPAQTLKVGEKPRSLAVGDLNADGRLDLVVADQSTSSVWVLQGKGNGTFLPPVQVVVQNSRHPYGVAIANFDDVGNPDLAVIDDRLGKIFILINDNANPPGFRRGGDLDIGDEPRVIRTVDLNGDGHLDILTVNFGGPRVKEMAVLVWKRSVEGFPEFEPVQRFTIGEKPEENAVIADFDSNGVPDVAILNRPIELKGNSEVEILLGAGNGALITPTSLKVPCPFFTGGAPCRGYDLAAGDFDGNGTTDLMVTLADPRRARGSASQESDAMQAFGGNGDGSFIGGPVIITQKVPISIAATDFTGEGAVDLVVANQKTLDLQAFVNTSTPGTLPNAASCQLGEDCLSDRCTNGVCCAAQCDPVQNEVCNVTGREGTCVPVPPVPVECATPDDCEATSPFCVDGFCCDLSCEGGHCDVDGFFGVCVPGIPDGEACNDDRQCSSDHCAPNFVCCREACEGGFCDDTGVCFGLLPNDSTCNFDEECESNVCDEFEGICCNRRCDPFDEICFHGEGVCRSLTYTPVGPTATPTRPPTPTVRLTPAAQGTPCAIPDDCDTTHCVNNVCCAEECAPDFHCEAGTGVCVPGAAGTPTPVPTSTSLPTLPTVDPCGGCPSGQICSGNQCVFAHTSGGCSTGDDPARGNLLVVAALPLALWMGRRWRLHRVRAGHRAPRQ